MAEIIDLNFYRRFRIILPMHSDANMQPMPENESTSDLRQHAKRLRRKRKINLTPKVRKKD
jgi:hypothetical protein